MYGHFLHSKRLSLPSRLIVLGWVACFACMSALASLFPAHSTVLLLSGLPGDIESESAYHDHIQGWLDLLQSSSADRVFVLCDSPETITLPAKPVCKASKNDRAGFLALGQELKVKAGPLVAIIWGHGGRQGGTPVLHVRGPRLAPSDLKDFAEQAQATDSYWVLCFNGSGAFARELANSRRQIISTECDTVFTSDPIGMGVLLKVARTRADEAFPQLAQEFGKMTAAWYSERSLARTEEPTLWLPDEKPRLLASKEEPDVVAAKTDAPEDRKPSVGKPEPETKPAPEDMKLRAKQGQILPAAWHEIKRVGPEKYRDADAISLRRRVNFTLGSNPAVVSEEDEFIQILAAEGKRHGDFDISYSPPSEDLTFLNCEVLRPDGELVELDPDAIREGADQSLGDYQVGRRKFFSLPGVVPGAILHVRYKRQWKEFPFPHISLSLPIMSEIPAVESTIRVNVPKNQPFHFAVDGLSAADPEVSQTSYASTYT